MSNTKKNLKQLFALGAVSVHCSAVSSSLEEKEITDHRLSNMEENCHAAEKWPAKLKVGEIRSVGQNVTQPELERVLPCPAGKGLRQSAGRTHVSSAQNYVRQICNFYALHKFAAKIGITRTMVFLFLDSLCHSFYKYAVLLFNLK